MRNIWLLNIIFKRYICCEFKINRMKKLLLVVVCLSALNFAFAQNKTANSTSYKSAAGVKVWDGGALNLKTFLKEEKEALEFIGFFYNGGVRITGLYEWHGNLSTEGELKWYAGGGAHVNLFKVGGVSGTRVGIDGIVGLDYKFKQMPLNVALDWQPAYEFGKDNTGGFSGNWGGLAVRYTF
jgi:hypothetical protein